MNVSINSLPCVVKACSKERIIETKTNKGANLYIEQKDKYDTETKPTVNCCIKRYSTI